jgi:hypothetical protein
MNKIYTQNSHKNYRLIFDSEKAKNTLSQKSSLGGQQKNHESEGGGEEFKDILKRKIKAV